MNIQELFRYPSVRIERLEPRCSSKPVPLPKGKEAESSGLRGRQISAISEGSGPSWVESVAVTARLLELDCPEEHRSDLMRLLASCENPAAIIDQLSNLYLVDEWPIVFGLLSGLIPVEIEVILNRTNQLNLTNKLKALEILVPMEDSDRAIVVYKTNALAIPDSQRLKALEIFSQEHDHWLVDQANKLPLIEGDRLEGMHLLLCLPVKAREPFCWWLAHLSRGIDRDEMLPIMKRFLFASEKRFQWVLSGMDELRFRFDLKTANPLCLLEIMEAIDENGLGKFIKAADSYIGSFMEEEKKMAILSNLSKMASPHWRLADRLLKFWMTDAEKIFLLQACSSIPESSLDYVVKEGDRLISFISHWKIKKLAKLIPKIALIPDSCRELFHAMAKEERLTLLKTIPSASEIVRVAWWHASDKDRKELYRLNEKKLQRSFIQLILEEKEGYYLMNVQEKEDYLLCPEEERDLFSQRLGERRKVRQNQINEVSRAMRREELDLNLRMRKQSSSAKWHASRKFWINALEMLEHPHRILLDYLSKKECVNGYPVIGYLNPEGERGESIDNWGLTRDFIWALFQALRHQDQKRLPMIHDLASDKFIPRIWHPNFLSEEERLELHPSQFAVLSEDLQSWCYLAIGLLFRVALNSRDRNSQPSVIGSYFDECALTMVYACNSRDDKGPERLQMIYLRKRYPQFFDCVDARDMHLFLHERKIPPKLEEKGIDEESWHELERTSLGVARAVIQIAKGIQMPSRLDVSMIPYKEFKGRIEGKFSREGVLKAFGLVSGKENWNQQEKDLMHWIGQADIRDVEKLSIAICGSGALVEDQRFQLAIDNSLSLEDLPRFSSCSQMMRIPPYPNYDILKVNLSTILKMLDEHAAAGVRFQGIL